MKKKSVVFDIKFVLLFDLKEFLFNLSVYLLLRISQFHKLADFWELVYRSFVSLLTSCWVQSAVCSLISLNGMQFNIGRCICSADIASNVSVQLVIARHCDNPLRCVVVLDALIVS